MRRSRLGLAVLILALAAAAAGCGRPAPAGTAGVDTGGGSAPAPGPGSEAPAWPATRVSEGGQVTVAVTWGGPDAGLVFQVVMDSHSVNLDAYDLRELAVLSTDAGLEVRPTAWDAPPGGHHRSGSLQFPGQTPDGTPVIGPGVRGITLLIRNVSGVPERVFQWTW